MEHNNDLSLQELNQKAGTCMQLGDVEGALEYISHILDKIDPAEVQIRAKTITNQGFLLAGLKRFSKAEKSFREASEIFQKDDDLVGMAIQVGNLGSLHRDQGEFVETLGNYQKALEILQEQNARPAIAD